MKKLVFENDIVRIHIDKGTLYHDLIYRSTLEEFKHAMVMGVILAKKHRCKKWIGDSRKAGVAPHGGSEWAEEVLVQQTIDAGVVHLALIVSDDIFTRLDMETFSENTDKQWGGLLAIRIFSSIKEAEAWMNQADPPYIQSVADNLKLQFENLWAKINYN